MWVMPVASMALALLVAPLTRWVDERTQWSLLGFGPDGAKAVIGALSSSLLTFVVFAFSILLLSVQVAGSQLSPRVIARVFETRLSRARQCSPTSTRSQPWVRWKAVSRLVLVILRPGRHRAVHRADQAASGTSGPSRSSPR
jgi:hypothetical protein